MFLTNYKFIFSFFLMLMATGYLPADPYAYHVQFVGTSDPEVLELLNSASQLTTLESSPPATVAALKRRVQEDTFNLLKALQSLAFYHAKVDIKIDDTQNPILITVTTETGPTYPFASLSILQTDAETNGPFPFDTIKPQDLDILIGSPALPSKIIEAEDKLHTFLSRQGYPLTHLVQREVIADQTDKTIAIIFHVETGPRALFGKTYVTGTKHIIPLFFCPKIAWREGEQYDPCAIVKTTNALEASGLFSSINITHDEFLQEDGTLPMEIAVKEAKHRSIAFGVGYATDLGGGVSAEWENRNIRGLGEKLSVVANVWQIKQEGYVRYIMPDFGHPGQDLIWKAEVGHEVTKGFRETAFILSSIVERKLTDTVRASYGATFTRLRNSRSNNNGDFNIFKIPVQLMWVDTNSLLDPTQGMSIHLVTTPALQTLNNNFAYVTHMLTSTAYHAIDEKHHFVLAAKATYGSIWGASDHRLPPSERFYAGSDSLLRGYRYLTVSPLGYDHKPIGGRSLMVYSFETRMRIKDPFGAVVFYDMGNVYKSSVPQFVHKQLQSVGLGLRYHTPVGPLRADIAFPLNRRPHLDPTFEFYFSIGQAF